MTNNTYTSEAPKSGYTEEETFALAATIWAEARGEGLIGMRAVAHVIRNRAAEPRKFGRGIVGVVKAPSQFSCWSRSDPNYRLLRQDHLDGLDPTTADGQRWRTANVIAENVLAGRDHDLTKGSVYFHTKQSYPDWAPQFQVMARIGSHIFYA